MTDHNLLILQALDPSARVVFNNLAWVVQSHTEVSDGSVIHGSGGCWGKTPEEATAGFVEYLKNIAEHEHIVVYDGVGYNGAGWTGRREYRWNGAAFARVPTFKEMREATR